MNNKIFNKIIDKPILMKGKKLSLVQKNYEISANNAANGVVPMTLLSVANLF